MHAQVVMACLCWLQVGGAVCIWRGWIGCDTAVNDEGVRVPVAQRRPLCTAGGSCWRQCSQPSLRTDRH